MHLLIVVDQNEKERFFGPFQNGEEALEWGDKNFNEDYFLAATTLYNPKEFIQNSREKND